MNAQEIAALKAEIKTASIEFAQANVDEVLAFNTGNDDVYRKALAELDRKAQSLDDVLAKLDALAIDTSRNYPNRGIQIGNGNSQRNYFPLA